MAIIVRAAAPPPGALAHPSAAALPALRARVDSLDLLRGLVMIVMMLDHVRDYTHASGLLYDPTDLARTTPVLFLTRWITHFCAPVFVFLAGTGAWLRGARGDASGLPRFLLTRGLWLVALELTVVRALIFFDLSPGFLGFLQVIWAIGVSMVVMAALVRLPVPVIGAIGVAIIAGHNLFDGVRATGWFPGRGTPPGALGGLWIVLRQGGFVAPLGADGPSALAAYPVIPWLGVMAAGYAAGALWTLHQAERRIRLLRLGAALTAAFVVLRALDVYGDPSRWSVQETGVLTALSFLRTTKYPPSLLFVLMTLGPALLLLGALDGRAPGRVGRALVTFGRVPLFFYVLQWLWAHTAAIVLSALAGRDTAIYFMSPPAFFTSAPPDYGFPLWVTYACWAAGVVGLWWPCRWYAGVKRRRREWWLSYL